MMKKHTNFSNFSGCHSASKGGIIGKESPDRKNEKGTKVPCEKEEPVQEMWTVKRILQKIRYMQNMSKRTGPPGRTPGSQKGELVRRKRCL